MISTKELINSEAATLDHMAKVNGGAWLAKHVADRTTKYLMQEMEKELRRHGANDFLCSLPRNFVDIR